MAVKDQVQYSLRMNRDLYDEVQTICKLSSSTMSKFIVTAVRSYAIRKRRKLQRSLTESLRILQEYANRDPQFNEAIKRVADAEVSGDVSPIEGKFYDVREGRKGHAVNSSSLEEILDNA